MHPVRQGYLLSKFNQKNPTMIAIKHEIKLSYIGRTYYIRRNGRKIISNCAFVLIITARSCTLKL